jgi:hypothetical protein
MLEIRTDNVPTITEVQTLFCLGPRLHFSASYATDAAAMADTRSAVSAAQNLATTAVRTARLIDFGEIPSRPISGQGRVAPPPFDGEPTAYTFVVRTVGASRATRFLLAVEPRTGGCSFFEISHTAGGSRSRWLATLKNGGLLAGSPDMVEVFKGAAWVESLAYLVSIAKLESIPAPADRNRTRRLRGLAPLPGYFTATLPPPSDVKTCAELGGHHASPEPHLRRGHLRRLRDGRNVSVRACCVRGGPPGVGARLHPANRQV